MKRSNSRCQSPRRHEPDKPNGAKLLIELAPFFAFFAAWAMYGMKTAAGVLAVATVLSVAAAWLVLRSCLDHAMGHGRHRSVDGHADVCSSTIRASSI